MRWHASRMDSRWIQLQAIDMQNDSLWHTLHGKTKKKSIPSVCTSCLRRQFVGTLCNCRSLDLMFNVQQSYCEELKPSQMDRIEYTKALSRPQNRGARKHFHTTRVGISPWAPFAAYLMEGTRTRIPILLTFPAYCLPKEKFSVMPIDSGIFPLAWKEFLCLKIEFVLVSFLCRERSDPKLTIYFRYIKINA